MFVRARACERRSPAAFHKRIVVHVDVSQARQRLDRDVTQRHPIAHFAEHLPDIAVEARLGLVGEAGEEDAAAYIDAV